MQELALHLSTCSMLRHCVPLLRSHTLSMFAASVFHSWGGGGVRACVALAQMLDVTPLGSAVALAHMLNATQNCVSLLGAVGECKSVHCTCPHARCYAIVFCCCTRTHARCYAIVFRCCTRTRARRYAKLSFVVGGGGGV